MLLNALRALLPNASVNAIHINHQLSSNSQDWLNHCIDQCNRLNINLETVSVNLSGNTGEGLESEARTLRYQVFNSLLETDDLLLMAHHLDDQIETFFLRLMRGSGVDGLSAMPEIRALDKGYLGRPFLSLSKAHLENYANENCLSWVEDESNASSLFDRNFLRNQVLPLISTRWPMYRKPLQRSINLFGELSKQLDQEIQPELQHRLTADGGLKVSGLMDIDRSLIKRLLREWIQGKDRLPPSQSQLDTIIDSVINAREDAQPVLKLKDYCIRRYQSAIYCTASLDVIDKASINLAVDSPVMIIGVGQVTGRSCQVNHNREYAIATTCLPLTLRFDYQGDSIKPANRHKNRDLKRLLQEYRVKPWLRDRLPLIYSGEQLVAVADIFVVDGFQANVGEQGIKIEWITPDL